MSDPPGQRARACGLHTLVAVVLAMAVLLGGCTTADTGDIRGIKPDPVLPATVYLAEAEEMIRQIVQAVSPGATITSHDSAYWIPCSSPLEGQVYKGITREFDAPPGRNGADLIPALKQQFRDRGYYLDPPGNTAEEHEASMTFRGATTHVGFGAFGAKGTPRVTILLDTQCGTPPPDDDDV